MNKKILAGVVLSVLLMGVAGQVLAQEDPQVSTPEEIPTSCYVRVDPGIEDCSVGDCPFDTDSPCAICCLVGNIIFITNWIFTALILLVVLFVLLGAFNIVTAAGDTNKITTGKNYILYAAIGLACALLARAVPNLVRYMVTGGA